MQVCVPAPPHVFVGAAHAVQVDPELQFGMGVMVGVEVRVGAREELQTGKVVIRPATYCKTSALSTEVTSPADERSFGVGSFTSATSFCTVSNVLVPAIYC